MIHVKPVNTSEDFNAMVECYQKMKKTDRLYPVYTTHTIWEEDKMIGGFALETPTIYWWMVPDMNTPRRSVNAFGCMESLLSEKGIEHDIMPCEESSPYYKMLESRLEPIKGEEGCIDWKLFVRTIK